LGRFKRMKLNNETIFRDSKKTMIIGMVVVAILCALIFAGLIKGVVEIVKIILALIIEYWLFILIGVGALLLIRKIFFRKGVQEMRIVK